MVHAETGEYLIKDAPVLERNYNADFASIQPAIYGGLAHSTLKLTPHAAVKAVLETIKGGFPNWKVLLADENKGIVQAEAEQGFFHFVDDVLIRIIALPGDEEISRVDIRSRSRYGRSDFGLNADRIKRFQVQLNERAQSMTAPEKK